MKTIAQITFLSRLTVLMLVLLACSCGNARTETSGEESPVNSTTVHLTEAQHTQAGIKTGAVAHREVSVTLRLNGRIDVPPQNMVSISIPLGGYLKSTKMLPGTHVVKGQVIAIMEDPQYIQLQQEYLVSRTKMVYAGQEQQRQKELNEGKAGSMKALQQAESELRSLTISTTALAEKLRLIGIDPAKLKENTISRQIAVRSPINGFISKVNGNIGSYVNPSDVLFELVNPDDIHLNLNVFEKDLDKLVIGQKAMAYTNNNPQKKYETEIILISRDLSPERIAEVHCHFENYDKLLVPGMYMNADIQLKSSDQPVLPERSVVTFEGKQYVFVETGNRIYQLTEVTAGSSDNGYLTISTSLDGKKVVTDGAYSLLMQLKNIAE